MKIFFMKFSLYLLIIIGFMSFATNTAIAQLNVGDKAPNFEGVNQAGDTVSLTTILADGPIVLTFYRGEWCPYCNKYLSALDENYPEMKKLGANLVAISPELPEYINEMAKKMEHPYTIISGGTSIMQQYGLDFQLAKKTINKYKIFGINLSKSNGNEDNTLPIPATYVIDKKGTIVYKHFDENYKVRAEVEEILSALESLNKIKE